MIGPRRTWRARAVRRKAPVEAGCDKVPVEADIYGTKLLCKHKRGKMGVHDKWKVRCVMLGNQLNAAEARRRRRATTGDAAGGFVELRVTAPTLRHSSFKCSAAVWVCKGMRRRTIFRRFSRLLTGYPDHTYGVDLRARASRVS